MKPLLALLILALPAAAQGLPFYPDPLVGDVVPETEPNPGVPAADGRANRGAGTEGGTGAGRTTGRRGGIPTSTPPPDWWNWWEFNKLAWTPPNPLGHERGAAQAYQVAEERRQLRRRLTPLLRADTRHAAANVRAAAVVALARVEGATAIEVIEACFDDPSPEVRRSAILALGATGSERAVHRLLQIARSGLAADDAMITPYAQQLAILALGLARRDGVGHYSSSFLPALSSVRGATDAGNLGQALLLHQFLAPARELEPVARELSGLFGRGAKIRITKPLTARAAEALRFEAVPDVAVWNRLGEEIDRRDLAFRRSVALTLAAIASPAMIDDVRGALRSERENMTRGFLLIALGRVGGPDERDLLIDMLVTGDRTMRPWCALALGVYARKANDLQARRALREELRNERNIEAAGAFYLASGVANDAQAIPAQGRALLTSPNARTRLHAAQALSLTRHANAGDPLRLAFPKEQTPIVRIAIAQALGRLGAVEDVPFLLGVLKKLRRLDFQPHVASALATHGTLPMAHGLLRALEEDELSAVGRGAAVQAVGLLVGEGTPYTVTQACQNANFTIFPEWLYEPILTTL